MALKQIIIDDVGQVTFQKKRGSRSIRIHIKGHEVRVTLPNWVPYAQAVSFVKSRKDWINENRQPQHVFSDGALIGKKHQLHLTPSNNSTMRTTIDNGNIKVRLPKNADVYSLGIQKKLQAICEKALLNECKETITPRIKDLSYTNDLPYNSLQFKKLKSRWGSCDHKSNIVLNTYLAQLTWPQIDYVITHELAHTKHHNHSKDFWQLVEDCLPDYKEIRRSLKQSQPHITVS